MPPPTSDFPCLVLRRVLRLGLQALGLLLGAVLAGTVQAARIKEVASIQGVRSNQLVGYGLVVGLDGTGDQTTSSPYTAQSLNAMLQQMGVTVPALGNAKSLRGGTLIATPLRGADGQIYALAQGNLVVGGAGAAAGGSKVQVNHLSAGRVPSGATVERAVPTPLAQGESLQLDLNAADFTTAREVVRAINTRFGAGTALALDGRVVKVKMPPAADERVGFLADIENLPLELATPAARIVVNARTGSIVLNQAVTLGPCAVAHGNLSVTISATPVISQPNPLSGGETVVAQKTDIALKQDSGSLIQLPAGTQLTEVVRALNSLGATPGDLLAILQALKAAGALNAELEVI
jgi:flagellar P-ring protein precursor FlgI